MASKNKGNRTRTFADRVTYQRLHAKSDTGQGMTVRQLADRVGIYRPGRDNLSWVKKMCAQGKANPSLSDVIVLAKALGVTPVDLIAGPSRSGVCDVEPYEGWSNRRARANLKRWFRVDVTGGGVLVPFVPQTGGEHRERRDAGAGRSGRGTFAGRVSHYRGRMRLTDLAEKVERFKPDANCLSWVRKIRTRTIRGEVPLADVLILATALNVTPLALIIDLTNPFAACDVEPYRGRANYKAFADLEPWFHDDEEGHIRNTRDMMIAAQLLEENIRKMTGLETRRRELLGQLHDGAKPIPATGLTEGERGTVARWAYRDMHVEGERRRKPVFDFGEMLRIEEDIADTWRMISGGRAYLQKHDALKLLFPETDNGNDGDEDQTNGEAAGDDRNHANRRNGEPPKNAEPIAEEAKPIAEFLDSSENSPYEQRMRGEYERAAGQGDLDRIATVIQDPLVGGEIEYEEKQRINKLIRCPGNRKWLLTQLHEQGENGRPLTLQQYWGDEGKYWMDVLGDIAETMNRRTDSLLTTVLEEQDDARRKEEEKKKKQEGEKKSDTE